jgi:inositol 1,4,5-triphosphate receptor type 1
VVFIYRFDLYLYLVTLTVYKESTKPSSLLLVGMLGMVIIFIYALVSFAVLRERFLLSSLGRHCTTVYECFITVLHHGFVDSLYTVSVTITNLN